MALPTQASRHQILQSVRFESTGNVCISFGPDDAYFLGSHGRWTYHGSQKELLDSLSIKEPYLVSLSPSGELYIAYQNKLGKPRCYFTFPQTPCPGGGRSKVEWMALDTLKVWINKRFDVSCEVLLQCTLTFGPGNSFFARCEDGHYIWNELPQELRRIIWIASSGLVSTHRPRRQSTMLQDRVHRQSVVQHLFGPLKRRLTNSSTEDAPQGDREIITSALFEGVLEDEEEEEEESSGRTSAQQVVPRSVALGWKNSWFVLWDDGTFNWRFYGGYARLDRILSAVSRGSLTGITLSPYDGEQFMMIGADGALVRGFAGDFARISQMEGFLRKDRNDGNEESSHRVEKEVNIVGGKMQHYWFSSSGFKESGL